MFVAAALATVTAVVLGGAIGFIGLMAPHAIRLAGVAHHRALLPLAVLLGGVAAHDRRYGRAHRVGAAAACRSASSPR